MSLIVADEEFERGASRIFEMSEEIKEILLSYSKIIEALMKDGINDILIDNVLSDKMNTLSSYRKEFTEISASLVEKTKAFIEDIDEADAYLYD
jgi:hypothetical protein